MYKYSKKKNIKIINNFQKLNKEKAVINKINKDTYEEISTIQDY